MADFNKIGLLVLNEGRDKFLVCEKDKKHVTDDYIMPGGKMEEKDDRECLRREIKEELNCSVDFDTLVYIGEYADIAAGFNDRQVKIKLYQGKLVGTATPATEINYLHWIGKQDADNPRVSRIIRNKIIPDLVKRKILI